MHLPSRLLGSARALQRSPELLRRWQCSTSEEQAPSSQTHMSLSLRPAPYSLRAYESRHSSGGARWLIEQRATGLPPEERARKSAKGLTE